MLVVDIDGDEGTLGEVDPQSCGGSEVVEDDFEAAHLGILGTEENQSVVGVLYHGALQVVH
jgi:hypothetical protein